MINEPASLSDQQSMPPKSADEDAAAQTQADAADFPQEVVGNEASGEQDDAQTHVHPSSQSGDEARVETESAEGSVEAESVPEATSDAEGAAIAPLPAETGAPITEAAEVGAVETQPADEPSASVDAEDDSDEDDDEDEAVDMDVEPLELIEEELDEELKKDWFILKVQVNRESSICDALQRRIKVAGLERFFGDILVPTEDVREFTKTGKQRVVKRKLYPGYIVVHMAISDDTWFLVRETPGIGDFTGSAGKPTPMETHEIEQILKKTRPDEEGEDKIKTTIKFKPGDRVRVKEGYFQNFEGDVDSIDEANGRITVMINIFGRPTPVELDHWQFEDV